MYHVRYVAIANVGEMPVKPHLRVVAPSNENRTVPVRRPNAELRTREYLTPAEIEKLIAVAKRGRYGKRESPRSQTWSGRRWSGVAVPLSTSVG